MRSGGSLFEGREKGRGERAGTNYNIGLTFHVSRTPRRFFKGRERERERERERHTRRNGDGTTFLRLHQVNRLRRVTTYVRVRTTRTARTRWKIGSNERRQPLNVAHHSRGLFFLLMPLSRQSVAERNKCLSVG